jgi:hypothetical protein
MFEPHNEGEEMFFTANVDPRRIENWRAGQAGQAVTKMIWHGHPVFVVIGGTTDVLLPRGMTPEESMEHFRKAIWQRQHTHPT